MASLKDKYVALVNELNHHSKQYYEKNSPEISDHEYDKLYRKLIDLESTHPELISPDSPSQKVGMSTHTGFAKEKHAYRMYSLDNVFNTDELKRFFRRFNHLRKDAPTDDMYYVDCKMDGVAVDLQYTGGKLAKAITRGNGIEGDDVTMNVATIVNVPKRINTTHTTFVRGEVVVHRTDFYAANRVREEAGEKPFSNTRNYAAGSLKQSDPAVTASRHLRFYAWELIVVGKRRFCVDEQMQMCVRLGFNVPKGGVASSLEEIVSIINTIARERNKLPYDIDGAVVKHNHPDYQKVLGWNNHAPLWATAWKFTPDGAVTTIERIEWQIGRTGRLTPVAYLTPVNINGVVVSAVTLNNALYVEENKIGPGAKIRVIRSGDVIPKISEIISSGTYLGIPEACPFCGGSVIRGRTDVKCQNSQCRQAFGASLKYIFGKDLLDVKGVGTEFIKAALKSETITSLIDVFAPIESKDPKNVSQELLDAMVTRARQVNFMELLMLLGIEGLGRAVAGKLAMEAENISGLLHILQQSNILQQIPVPESVKTSLRNWYASDDHKKLLKDIASLKLPTL